MNMGFLFFVAWGVIYEKIERISGQRAGTDGVYGLCYKCAIGTYYHQYKHHPGSLVVAAAYQERVEDLT